MLSSSSHSQESEKGKTDQPKKEYFCKLCHAKMNSASVWKAHITGKKHLKNLSKTSSNVGTSDEPVLRAKIEEQLKDVGQPILGLKYITETHYSDPALYPSYKCRLCQISCDKAEVTDHLLSTQHRLNYMKENDKEGYEVINSMRKSSVCIDNLAEDHAVSLEKSHGRGYVEVKMEHAKYGDLASMRKRRQKNVGAVPVKKPNIMTDKEVGDQEARAQSFLRKIPFSDIDTKMKIISKFSSNLTITDDEEAIAVMRVITMMEQLVLQCKLKILSPELHQNLNKYIPSETVNDDLNAMTYELKNRVTEMNRFAHFPDVETSRQSVLDLYKGNSTDVLSSDSEVRNSQSFRSDSFIHSVAGPSQSSSVPFDERNRPISYPPLSSYGKSNMQSFRHGF